MSIFKLVNLRIRIRQMVQKMPNLILNWTYLLQLSSVQCSRCSSTYRFAGKPQKSAPTQKTGAIMSYFSKELSISKTSLSPSLSKIRSHRDLLVIHEALHQKNPPKQGKCYTQYPIIRNGHIRNTSEIWGNFKKRLVSQLNLRNALKKLRNAHCPRFLG